MSLLLSDLRPPSFTSPSSRTRFRFASWKPSGGTSYRRPYSTPSSRPDVQKSLQFPMMPRSNGFGALAARASPSAALPFVKRSKPRRFIRKPLPHPAHMPPPWLWRWACPPTLPSPLEASSVGRWRWPICPWRLAPPRPPMKP